MDSDPEETLPLPASARPGRAVGGQSRVTEAGNDDADVTTRVDPRRQGRGHDAPPLDGEATQDLTAFDPAATVGTAGTVTSVASSESSRVYLEGDKIPVIDAARLQPAIVRPDACPSGTLALQAARNAPSGVEIGADPWCRLCACVVCMVVV